MLIALSLSISGCAVAKHGHATLIPGCRDAYVYVPDGCYEQHLPDRVEVRCPNSTTKYKNCYTRAN